jgi:uncharacterized protein (TIGR00369 family)
MIVDEIVRGQMPPPWFWALPGIDRIRAFSLSQLPSPPISRLLGIRPAHVGPGSGTWTMPATAWSQLGSGELEFSMLAETALTGVAMTTLTPGLDVEPVTLVLNYFRPARVQPGNLLARARVVNTSRFFIFAEVEIEDPQGRQIAQAGSQCRVRAIDPPPPPPPSELRPAEEATYATPDPYLRTASEVPSFEMLGNPDAATLLQAYTEGRFVVPFFELTGCRVEAKKEREITMTMPANEWLCRFSHSIAPGAIAALTNSATRTSAWLETRQDQSFVGLAQSLDFYRLIPADGRIVRVHSVGTVHERSNVITADVRVYDADGALTASGHGVGQTIDASKRQKRRTTESKRILATLLFTDIVGSTQHAERLGDARWRALLTEHRYAARGEILRCEGAEIDTAGDGFFVRFDSPARALECARAVRDGVKRLGIEIRVGVHTGECEQQGRTVTGMAVHIASRIQALAEAGEILASNTVKDLVVGSGLHFKDRGEHTLKGVPGEWHLFALAD